MTQRTPDQLVGRVIGGRFRITAPIGRGRNTLVLAAEDLEGELGEPSADGLVAVKLLPSSFASDPSFVRRFRHEVRNAASIDHPNVVRVHAWGDEGQFFIVNEFMAGGSLRAVLNQGRHLSPPQAASVGVDIARGLDHLHRRGILHRAIRPSNIMFRRDGRAAIADTGVGWLLEETMSDDALDFRFLAPEMADDVTPTGTFDVYSLGLTLMESADGKIPLLGPDLGATLAIRDEHEAEPGPEWGAFRRPLTRALRRDPAERSTAGELEIGLMAVADRGTAPEAVTPAGALGTDGAEPSISSVQPTFVPPLTRQPGPDPEALADGEPPRVRRRQTSASVEADVANQPTKPTPTPTPTPPEDDLEPVDVPTEPTERRKRNVWPAVGAAVVVLAIAALLRMFVFSSSGDVPALVGRDKKAAETAAKEHGWDLEIDELIRKDGTVADEIVAQSPKPGSSLGKGEALTVTVSLGAELAPLPDVVGMTVEQATQALSGAGFRPGDVKEQFDEKAKSGTIVLTDAAVDQQGQLPRDTVVNLVVSQGPAPRTIPADLVGRSQADASEALTKLGLKVRVNAKSDEKVAAGTVMTVTPNVGSQVDRGSTVTLVVSSGKPAVSVPFTGGDNLLVAQEKLTKAGLAVGTVEGPVFGKVAGTDPAAGAQVPPGTKVRIVMQ